MVAGTVADLVDVLAEHPDADVEAALAIAG